MNNNICQIIDSSGNLQTEFMKYHNISEVSFYFKFKNTDYFKENVDWDTTEFFKYMKKHPDDVPNTSAPNIYDWLSIFNEQYRKGVKQYIVTTISAKLSNSYNTAILAKNIFKEENNDVQISIIDSNTCACGKAALEIWIAKMIEIGKDYNYIIEMINKKTPNINSIFVVDSLIYMNAGGRIGGAATFLGKVINIKPVCEFINGDVHVIKPIIGRKKSLKSMIDIVVSRITQINKAIIVIQNAIAQQDADYMRNYLWEKTNSNIKIYSNDLGITVGAHSGPGSIGIGFIENDLFY